MFEDENKRKKITKIIVDAEDIHDGQYITTTPNRAS